MNFSSVHSKNRVDAESWEDSAIGPEKTTFGFFVNDRIVAACLLGLMWAEQVANIGLITEPEFRGKGYAKRVCQAASKFGEAVGYLMLYQTLLSNDAAVRVAERAGYKQYGTHLAVRFT